jgi:CO dehydrogenase/acetyl-CoA synthase gamma subunit (corrinoid Fe-S protein)
MNNIERSKEKAEKKREIYKNKSRTKYSKIVFMNRYSYILICYILKIFVMPVFVVLEKEIYSEKRNV